jgi:hypothetical protein
VVAGAHHMAKEAVAARLGASTALDLMEGTTQLTTSLSILTMTTYFNSYRYNRYFPFP